MGGGAAGATDAAGTLTVSGTSEYGQVTAVIDVVDGYASVECDTLVDGTHHGPLSIRSGVTCLEDGARVLGPVNVADGAGLVADGARIAGPVSSTGAEALVLCDTRVSGPVSLAGGDSVMLGDPALGCASNHVSGPVTVTDTTGWNVIAGNEIDGPLACTANDPAPVDNGTTNQVRGPRTGQCAAL
ncbi:hypothetical protein GCM10029992_50380 [Glycomyces albus]